MRVRPVDAARIMGCNVMHLYTGLQQGAYPFGTAFRKNGARNYQYDIMKIPFAKYLGITVEELEELIENG